MHLRYFSGTERTLTRLVYSTTGSAKLVSTQSHKVLDVIHDVFEPRLPREAAALQRVLEKPGRIKCNEGSPKRLY
jgi:hypothetical protein